MIGVIPAGGLGTRLAPLGYPKELLPIVYAGDDGRAVPRPVLLSSLDQMRAANVEQCMIVIADWKLELVRVLGERQANIALSYVVRQVPRGLADAIDATHAWLSDRDVCLALPDTLIEPDDALARVGATLASTGADLVLGVFPTDRPEQLGPVRVDADGRVRDVQDKPASVPDDMRNTWGIAAWTPAFGELLHAMVGDDPGVILGVVYQRAVERGLDVRGVVFDGGSFIDVGTPEGLAAAFARSRG
ncbi:MAG: sugar phosphate nucleotidyltransferase [Kofleriaceae bacterium]